VAASRLCVMTQRKQRRRPQWEEAEHRVSSHICMLTCFCVVPWFWTRVMSRMLTFFCVVPWF
jgi:hypothetical protein